MTCQQLDADHFRLSFSEPEAHFIITVLARLGVDYRARPEEMPPQQRLFWQGRPAAGAKADFQESQEILAEAREELRSERAALVESWVRDFELAETHRPWVVELTEAERDEFISMLNDRRLLLAIEVGITDGDMEAQIGQIPSEARRNAILEIDLLGHFIMVVLRLQN